MDLYQQLEIERTASQDQIKKAYRTLARRNHPDVNPDDPEAEERFKDVSNAYDILSDPEKRKLYDEFGDLSLTKGFDADLARAHKAAQTSRGREASPGWGGKSRDARDVSFDDLLSRMFRGSASPFGPSSSDPFGPSMFDPGRSARSGTPGDPLKPRPADMSAETTITMLDSLLGATVRLNTAGRSLDVTIPQGLRDGTKMRLSKQGASVFGVTGDLILTVHVHPSDQYTRVGFNIHTTTTVTAYQAYRGALADVETPWGVVAVKLVPGTQSGQMMRLRGRGVRVKGTPKGDMLVTLKVWMPEPGDAELLAVLERLQGKS